MPSPTALTLEPDAPDRWGRALYAFLVEKERRSGSRRTVESYSRMLQDCFGRLGQPPDAITGPEVLAYAHGIGLSGREPSATTVAAQNPAIQTRLFMLAVLVFMLDNPGG